MISEFDIIDRFFQKPTYNAIVGIGDDAAIVPASQHIEFAISTDTLVSGRHFFPDVDPYKLGYKSLAVNLSDMAAMGARPRWALLALTLPKNLVAHDNAWLSEFSQGFFDLASTYQVELIGGDTTAGPLNINVQIIGEVMRGKALRRNNAQAGDDIWVSGQLGNAALALKHELRQITLTPEELSQCLPALLMPSARIELGQRLVNLAHSAIDISDGLVADLGHILENSATAACINLHDIPCLPIIKRNLSQPRLRECLLSGGDDYELCFTAPEKNRDAIELLGKELNLPLTRIGKILTGHQLIIKDHQGKLILPDTKGYDHFIA